MSGSVAAGQRTVHASDSARARGGFTGDIDPVVPGPRPHPGRGGPAGGGCGESAADVRVLSPVGRGQSSDRPDRNAEQGGQTRGQPVAGGFSQVRPETRRSGSFGHHLYFPAARPGPNESPTGVGIEHGQTGRTHRQVGFDAQDSDHGVAPVQPGRRPALIGR